MLIQEILIYLLLLSEFKQSIDVFGFMFPYTTYLRPPFLSTNQNPCSQCRSDGRTPFIILALFLLSISTLRPTSQVKSTGFRPGLSHASTILGLHWLHTEPPNHQMPLRISADLHPLRKKVTRHAESEAAARHTAIVNIIGNNDKNKYRLVDGP